MALAAIIFPAAPWVATPNCLAAESTSVAQREITTGLENWRDQFNAGNSAAVCDLFAPDLIANFQGQPQRDFNSLCGLLRTSLRDRARRFHYSLAIKEIIVAGDLAAVRLVWTLTAQRNGATQTSIEPGMDIFQRRGGVWRIIRFMAYAQPATPGNAER